jgi:hypothetical protein
LLDTSSENAELPLFLGPGDARPKSPELIPFATGHAPFWIDDQTFGYVRRLDMSEFQPRGYEDVIFIGTLNDTTPQKLISSADLAQFLPDDNRFRRSTIAYVATNPNAPRLLFITLLDELERRAYVFSYDMDERVPQLRMDLLYDLNHSLGFSPDGRYLVMTGSEPQAPSSANVDNAILLLYDLVEDRTIPFVSRLPFFLPSVGYDWSEDGRWLAIVHDDNLVGLVEPREGRVRLLPHNFGACTSIAWLMP